MLGVCPGTVQAGVKTAHAYLENVGTEPSLSRALARSTWIDDFINQWVGKAAQRYVRKRKAICYLHSEIWLTSDWLGRGDMTMLRDIHLQYVAPERQCLT